MVFTLENYLAISKQGQWFHFTDHDNKVYANLIVREGDKPTEQECIDGIAALQEDYDSRQWFRNRQKEYPSNGDQWDMIYKDNKNSTTTHATAVEAVKTKWPKDNSGPVE